jgi:hypothetical protein
LDEYRNAWWWSTVGNQFFLTSLQDAKRAAEGQRIQGSHFRVAEVPVCVFDGDNLSLIGADLPRYGTDVRRFAPFSGAVEDDYGADLSEAAERIRSRFPYVSLFVTARSTLKGPDPPFPLWTSVSPGTFNIRLSWHRVEMEWEMAGLQAIRQSRYGIGEPRST